MARPKIPNSRKAYNALNTRTERYLAALNQVYETYNKEASKIALRTSYDGEKPFSFSDYPQTSAAVKKLQKQFAGNLNTTIVKAVTTEWDNANKFNDSLVKTVLKRYGADAGANEFQKYFNNNDAALKAFINRKNKGFNLSANIWEQSNDYIEGLEAAISNGLSKGMSAITLSKRISKYLKDFPSLKKDYSEKFGKAAHIKDCEYRSARLARTEINMAYRSAENARWKQLDFIVGFEIKRSGRSFACPVCESLTGKYPKDFLFVGWHPNCRCYQISILNTEEEFWSDSETSVNEITDVPDNFKQWVADNSDRIQEAEQRGTLPYFLKDNKDYYKNSTIQLPAILRINDIEDLVNRGKDSMSAFVDKDGNFIPERKMMHDHIVEELLSNGSTSTNTVYLLGGAPANGKSTLLDSGSLPHPNGILTIDPDEIKKKIYEYKLMLMSENQGIRESAAAFIHEESSFISKILQEKARERKFDYVLDGVNDGKFEKISEKIAKIKRYGVRVRADYVTLDTELSIKLAISRAEKTGRSVPLDFVNNMNSEISILIPELIKNKTFDDLYLWDTNVIGKPRLILSQIDGKLEIYNQHLYDSFLRKAKR